MAKALLTDGLLSVFPVADACSAEGLDHDPHMTPSEAEKRNRSLGSKKIHFDVDASLCEKVDSLFHHKVRWGEDSK